MLCSTNGQNCGSASHRFYMTIIAGFILDLKKGRALIKAKKGATLEKKGALCPLPKKIFFSKKKKKRALCIKQFFNT